MDTVAVKRLGPIEEADITFGDLTLFVGPQASGKSILLQLLKLLVDRKHIRKTLEQYNFVWSRDTNVILDRYFGEGMHGVWRDQTEIVFDGSSIDKTILRAKQNDRISESVETMFYVPAQRILSIADGRPKFFTEFDESAPYVIRQFSETLRLIYQNETTKKDTVFPQNNRLKEPLRASFIESVFHNGEIISDEKSGQKKLRMRIDGMSIPFMTWSAGQKEFMPLLLGFYWLCPPAKVATRDKIKYVVIEEPEMGLHPQAIVSVILQVIDLLSRGYKIIISTHSPVLLEFAWAFTYMKTSNAGDGDFYKLFDLRKSAQLSTLFKSVVTKKIHTYYFDRANGNVLVRDISSLDAGSEDMSIAEWGGLSSFSSKATDIISELVTNEDQEKNHHE